MLQPNVKITPADNLPANQLEDAALRVAALEKIAQYLETDVLQLLAGKVHKLGINTKVRLMHHVI